LATFTYPTSAELMEIAQERLPRLMEGRVVFDFFPIAEVDAHLLKWEQMDNFLGLQKVRGLNGEPPRVKRVGQKVYQMNPGAYGEFVPIDEQELTSRRQTGTFGDPISVDDLVSRAELQLEQRELDRIELIIWTLLATGTFSVSNENGAVTHTDAYTTQTFTAGITWATSATAIPLGNFRAVQLLGRGKGVSFGAGARAYMNRSTLNAMLGNTNANDLAGRRASGLLSVLNLNEVNNILMGEDLPTVVPYDEGYLDDAGAFQLFVPNNKVVVIGQRPNNQDVGEYRKTRNANNPDLGPGSYTMIYDSVDAQKPPRNLEVHRGHNGGPVIFFPSAAVTMTV
jgi:hypothetical protein